MTIQQISDKKVSVAELGKFLESNRKVKKRPKIDFNNLPQRAAEPTKAKPRLNKEEFKPVQQARRSPEESFALLYPGQSLAETGYHPPIAPKPVQVASLEPLSGIVEQPPGFPPTSGMPGQALESFGNDGREK